MVKYFWFCGFALLSISHFADGHRNYSGYELFTVTPHTDRQLRLLQSLERLHNSSEGIVDFWRAPSLLDHPVQVLVGPEFKSDFLSRLRQSSISARSVISDLQKFINEENFSMRGLRRSAFDDDFSDSYDDNVLMGFQLNEYHSYQEIYDFLLDLTEANDDVMKFGVMGKSFEGRSLIYVKIGYPSESPKKALFVDAGIHAREWIAPAVALFFITELATREKYTSILEKIDIYVLPFVNPDGYEYTRTFDRMWRKTRSGPHGAKGCFGVDANRNFPSTWGAVGVTRDPCDYQIFCGLFPLSEPETSALAIFLKTHRRSIGAYVTLHSYGNYVIFPYGFGANVYPNDIADLRDVASNVVSAIKSTTNEIYEAGTAIDLLNYTASGASDDYAKLLGIKYSYTIELTDTPYGFILPADQIVNTAKGATRGLVVIAKAVQDQL